MREEDGQVIEVEASVEEMIRSVEISQADTDRRREELMAKDPVLQVRGLKTWFPVERNVLGKVTRYVKAVDDVSFDV